MRFILALIICSILYVKVILAGNGIDISSPTSKTVTATQWSCLAKQNTKAIIQVWSGGYGYNTNIAQVVSQAKSAGIQTVDLYAFLCSQCSGNSPSSSAIKTLISNLKSDGVSFGTLWIDVEQCSGCWGQTSANAQFVVEAVQTAQQLGVNVGVYSSLGEWSQTVGSLNSLSSFPLWYAHYDNNPSFSDSSFYNFGSWSSPSMKQYQGNTQQCGVSVDLDYFEGGGSSSSSSSSSSTTGPKPLTSTTHASTTGPATAGHSTTGGSSGGKTSGGSGGSSGGSGGKTSTGKSSSSGGKTSSSSGGKTSSSSGHHSGSSNSESESSESSGRGSSQSGSQSGSQSNSNSNSQSGSQTSGQTSGQTTSQSGSQTSGQTTSQSGSQTSSQSGTSGSQTSGQTSGSQTSGSQTSGSQTSGSQTSATSGQTSGSQTSATSGQSSGQSTGSQSGSSGQSTGSSGQTSGTSGTSGDSGSTTYTSGTPQQNFNFKNVRSTKKIEIF